MDKQMNVPALRFPEFKGEWESHKMGEVYSFKVTNSFSRENLNYENGTVKNIHYGDIHTKFQTLFDITKENVPFINPDIYIERISTDNYCKEGDLILATNGTMEKRIIAENVCVTAL
jgi:type I restriction enzyme S subunit